MTTISLVKLLKYLDSDSESRTVLCCHCVWCNEKSFYCFVDGRRLLCNSQCIHKWITYKPLQPVLSSCVCNRSTKNIRAIEPDKRQHLRFASATSAFFLYIIVHYTHGIALHAHHTRTLPPLPSGMVRSVLLQSANTVGCGLNCYQFTWFH